MGSDATVSGQQYVYCALRFGTETQFCLLSFFTFFLFYPSIITHSEMVADLQVQAWDWACVYALNTNNWVFPFCVIPLSVLGAALKLRGSSNPISLSEEGTGSWWLCSDVASYLHNYFCGSISVYLNGLWSWILVWFVCYSTVAEVMEYKFPKEIYISWKASVAVLRVPLSSLHTD